MSMIGKTLAHYEISSQLGKGGMGEVYQARDQKLGRDVAIKVLPAEFAQDSDRIARFQREAKLLASLNHPNIASIYGLEESDGTHFLILELIKGDTLSGRLKSGSIPIEESLKLALQIAEALEAAHEEGVIHRDLKPANIKVTPDGKVKVLDFGLAKAYAGDSEDMNLSNSPTLSVAATQQGVILGTAAYMSPEQAKGKSADKATDIWAFGCVLYEMLTGQAAFQGDDVTEILASVVKASVNLEALPANTHPRIREILTRCLQKDQKRRYSRIADAQYEIEQVLVDPGGVLVQPVTTASSRKKTRIGLPWLAAAIVLTAVVIGLAVWNMKPAEPRPVIRLEHELPVGQRFSDLNLAALAVSPDGTQVVYSTPAGLYMRRMNELEARLIPGTEDSPQQPFFSPDGKWIGYFSNDDKQIKKIAIGGGASMALCDEAMILGASWGVDNTIVYSPVTGVMQISANGGTSELLVEGKNEVMSFPELLPDGKSVLFTVQTDRGNQIALQTLETGERKELLKGGSSARYLPSGYIVYVEEDDLLAAPFDLDNLEITGGGISLIGDALRVGAGLHYAVSNTGSLAYITSSPGSAGAFERNLVWIDQEGHEELIAAPPKPYEFPRVSPDGKQVAFTAETGGNYDIWIYDLVRGISKRLTTNQLPERCPLWATDGKKIAFHWDRDHGIYWKSADGTGETEPIGSVPEGEIFPWSWSNDGKSLIVHKTDQIGLTNIDIGLLSLDGDNEFKPLLQESYDESQPRLSRDGKWLAYTSNESGRNEICVCPFPEVDDGRWQVSSNGGNSPLWAPNGRELFYRNGDDVMAATVNTESTFSFEAATILFRGSYVSDYIRNANPWDINPDGKRFLMIKESEIESAEGTAKITIVLNWLEELKERVPVE